MPKAKTRESVADTPSEPERQSWPVAAVWHVGAEGVEPVQEEAVLPRLLEELATYLWNEHAKAAGREGYLALVAGGNAAWADEQHLAKLLPLIEAEAGRLVADAMGRMGDRLPWSDHIASGTDREPFVAWAFTDTNLARLEKYVNNFIYNFSETARMHRSDTPPPPSTSTDAPIPNAERPRFLETLLETVPADASYEEQARGLEELKRETNRQIDARVTDLLKAETLRRFPVTDTYDSKLELTRWLNAELQKFNLNVSSNKVGGPATLSTSSTGGGGGGRFSLKGKLKDDAGKHARWYATTSSDLLNHLEFEPAHRREPLSDWRNRIGQRGGGGRARE